ncbi:TPA: hypothetical protein ACH7I1_004483 [Escherichia coli]
MTETDLLKIIRRITGISQQPDEQATQPDSVIAEKYLPVEEAGTTAAVTC